MSEKKNKRGVVELATFLTKHYFTFLNDDLTTKCEIQI